MNWSEIMVLFLAAGEQWSNYSDMMIHCSVSPWALEGFEAIRDTELENG